MYSLNYKTMEELYWTTKDGTKILVDDMSESHVRNTLKMIIRNNNEAKRANRKLSINHIERQLLNDELDCDYGYDPNWD